MKSKKKLGIIGGMGSRAGAEFFKKVIDYSPAVYDQDFVEVILHNNASIPDRTRAIVYKEACPVDELTRSVQMLNSNGVHYIVLTCNTAYYYYNTLAAISAAMIVSPVQLIRDYIVKNNYRKVGLLATTGTIQTGIYHQALLAEGVEICTLDDNDREELFMKSIYMENGLKSSRVSDEAVNMMRQCGEKLIKMGAELIIGACSEVSIAISQDLLSRPYIDTMDLLARKVVQECYELPEQHIFEQEMMTVNQPIP